MSTVGRFAPWLERERGTIPITRVAYRALQTIHVLQLIQAAEHDRLNAQTEVDQTEAEFALEELRAVLEERSGTPSATIGA